jgi:hypothetical protein
MLEKLKKNWSLVAILLGVFAVLTIFFPAGIADSDSDIDTTIAGLRAVFGAEAYDEKVLDFSFLALLAYAAPLAGIALLVLADMKGNKMFGLVAAACFAVGAVLMFLMPELVKYTEEMYEDYFDIELGAGCVIGAIVSLVAAVCAFFSTKAEA